MLKRPAFSASLTLSGKLLLHGEPPWKEFWLIYSNIQLNSRETVPLKCYFIEVLPFLWFLFAWVNISIRFKLCPNCSRNAYMYSKLNMKIFILNFIHRRHLQASLQTNLLKSMVRMPPLLMLELTKYMDQRRKNNEFKRIASSTAV